MANLPEVEDRGWAHVAQFGSVGEMVDCANDKSLGNCWSAKRFANARMDEYAEGSWWTNNKSTEWCKTATTNAPSELMIAVERAKIDLEDKLPFPTRKRRKRLKGQTDGDEIDPQKLLQGLSDCWDKITIVRVPKRVIRICVNVTVNAGQSAENLRWRGAVATALADLMTQAGFSVEIVAVFYVANICKAYKHFALEITVKRSDCPLDIAAVAVSLASIGFFRIAILNVAARLCKTEPHHGLGKCRQIKEIRDAGDYDVVLDYGVDNLDASLGVVEAYTSKENAKN